MMVIDIADAADFEASAPRVLFDASGHIGGDLYGKWGTVGLSVLRQVHDNDAYYNFRQQGRFSDIRRNDVEFTFAANGRYFFPAFDLSGTLAIGRQYNRYYRKENDVTNLHAQIAVHWRVLR